MLNDNATLNPILAVESKIQSRVAIFLMGKEKLAKLIGSPSAPVSDKAKALMAVQDSLQNQLPSMLASVERLKTGAWTFSEVASLTAYAYSLDKQIRDTEDLGKEAATGAAPGLFSGEWTEWVPYAFLGVLGVSLLGTAIKKKRRE